MPPQTEERLSIVESALAEFIIQTNKSLHRMELGINELKNEMKDFKDEMKDFKDEMKQDRKDMNKKWGDLANKMGTLVEDIILPASAPVIKKYWQEELSFHSIRVKKHLKEKNLKGEFDVIAAGQKQVYLIEVKSNPQPEQILTFKDKKAPLFRQLFPEYKALKLIPIFASLRFDEDLIHFATQHGIYLLAYREWEYMDILNFEEIS